MKKNLYPFYVTQRSPAALRLYPALTRVLRLLEPGCLIQDVTVRGYQNPLSASKNEGRERVWGFSQSPHEEAAGVGARLFFRGRCNFVIQAPSLHHSDCLKKEIYVACAAPKASVFLFVQANAGCGPSRRRLGEGHCRREGTHGLGPRCGVCHHPRVLLSESRGGTGHGLAMQGVNYLLC